MTDVLQSKDTYAATEVLSHFKCLSLLPTSAAKALRLYRRTADLGSGSMRTGLMKQLTSATAMVEPASRSATPLLR